MKGLEPTPLIPVRGVFGVVRLESVRMYKSHLGYGVQTIASPAMGVWRLEDVGMY